MGAFDGSDQTNLEVVAHSSKDGIGQRSEVVAIGAVAVEDHDDLTRLLVVIDLHAFESMERGSLTLDASASGTTLRLCL